MNGQWETKKLGTICQIVGGGTPSKVNKSFYGGDIPWATVRDMKADVIMTTEHSITKQAVQKSSTNIVPANNVIIATRVGLGKVCLVKQDTAINQDLRGIIADTNQLNVMYLFWWLKSIAHIIVNEGTGATVQGVKLPFIRSLEIPVPPLVEQNNIVQQLDAASSEATRLQRIYLKNLENLTLLRQSILQKAFAGELRT